MKRFLLPVLLIGICGIATLFGDDNVRAAQERLKEGGFYFGEANGDYNSETAAAVSRYQIRNGLPITGQLDAETAKALGVTSPTEVPLNSAGSDTWRRLRKADQQFLKKLNSGQIPPPAAASDVNAAARPTVQPGDAAQPPRPSPSAGAEASTFVLSRERLRDYVAAFVLAGLDPHVGAELEFFGDEVNYFDSGVIGRDQIRGDLRRYGQQWPQRRFWLAGEVDVQPQTDSRIRVTFPLQFDLRNGSQHSSGKVQKTLLLELTGEDLRI
ncbi:MAG: peptidoglycan-binding protein, partial [Chthoniobacterales bacterium]|nr:peptidoglycan-binding protein [Chthoniobacterales bacterium]